MLKNKFAAFLSNTLLNQSFLDISFKSNFDGAIIKLVNYVLFTVGKYL